VVKGRPRNIEMQPDHKGAGGQHGQHGQPQEGKAKDRSHGYGMKDTEEDESLRLGHIGGKRDDRRGPRKDREPSRDRVPADAAPVGDDQTDTRQKQEGRCRADSEHPQEPGLHELPRDQPEHGQIKAEVKYHHRHDGHRASKVQPDDARAGCRADLGDKAVNHPPSP